MTAQGRLGKRVASCLQDEQQLMDDSAFDFACQPARDAGDEAAGQRVGADIDTELSTFAGQLGWEGTESLCSFR